MNPKINSLAVIPVQQLRHVGGGDGMVTPKYSINIDGWNCDVDARYQNLDNPNLPATSGFRDYGGTLVTCRPVSSSTLSPRLFKALTGNRIVPGVVDPRGVAGPATAPFAR